MKWGGKETMHMHIDEDNSLCMCVKYNKEHTCIAVIYIMVSKLKWQFLFGCV